MNYQSVYSEIIERAKSRGLNKKLLKGYFEKHHIIPRSLNGTDDKSNLVLLTAREHFICHHLLWKIYHNKETLYALYCMSHMKRKRNGDIREIIKLSSRQIETIKHLYLKRQSEKRISEETKAKLRKAALFHHKSFYSSLKTSFYFTFLL